MEVLVSFKAGLAHLADGVITPDPRRGTLRVIVVESEGLLHFQWGPREVAAAFHPEIDFVILPEEADFAKVAQPGARILHLHFKDAGRDDLFFWMQETDASQDAVYCQLVQQTINMGDEGGASESDMGSKQSISHSAAEFGGQEGTSGGGTISDQAAALASILAGIAPPPQTAAPSRTQGSQPAAAPPGGAPSGVTPEMLSGILAGVVGAAEQRPRLPSLSQVLTPQSVLPLLQEESLRNRLDELVEHLPRELQEGASAHVASAVPETWRSAALQNQLRVLSQALASGQLDFGQFGLEHLGYSAADFLQSIQNKADADKKRDAERQ